ncbi:MAG: hypothetical protein GC161_12170 [Planctomycetaceae bacterium]|nr:hypothetical protein [Planctomycetaceae bacterium]
MEARARLELARERLLAALATTRAASSPRWGEDSRRSNLRLALWLAQESARNLLLRLARGPAPRDSTRAAEVSCEELLALAARLQEQEGHGGQDSREGGAQHGAADGRARGGADGRPDPA